MFIHKHYALAHRLCSSVCLVQESLNDPGTPPPKNKQWYNMMTSVGTLIQNDNDLGPLIWKIWEVLGLKNIVPLPPLIDPSIHPNRCRYSGWRSIQWSGQPYTQDALPVATFRCPNLVSALSIIAQRVRIWCPVGFEPGSLSLDNYVRCGPKGAKMLVGWPWFGVAYLIACKM